MWSNAEAVQAEQHDTIFKWDFMNVCVVLQAMKKKEVVDPAATPAYDDGGTSPKQLIQTVVGEWDWTAGILSVLKDRKSSRLICFCYGGPRENLH